MKEVICITLMTAFVRQFLVRHRFLMTVAREFFQWRRRIHPLTATSLPPTGIHSMEKKMRLQLAQQRSITEETKRFRPWILLLFLKMETYITLTRERAEHCQELQTE